MDLLRESDNRRSEEWDRSPHPLPESPTTHDYVADRIGGVCTLMVSMMGAGSCQKRRRDRNPVG